MTNWLIRLEGEDLDLAFAMSSLHSSIYSIAKEGETYYLKSSLFDPIHKAHDVLSAAKRAVEVINCFFLVHSDVYRPIRIGNEVLRARDSGERKGNIFLEGIWDPRPDFIAPLNGDVILNSLGVMAWLDLSQTNDAVADALHFLNMQDWLSLWKVYEIIKDDIGGESKIFAKGWTTINQLRRLTRTVNSIHILGDRARHAKRKIKSPSNPMTLSEARQFMKGIVEEWIIDKLI